MAGLGYKDFTAGAVLTAAQVDGYLMEQAVMNFAGTAARGSALSSVQAAGMMAHVGGGTVTVYDGSAWQQVYPNTPGLVYVAGTAFSAVSSVSVNNCFTSTYDNYRVVVEMLAAAGAPNVSFRLRVGGSDDTGANYAYQYIYGTGASAIAARGTAQTGGWFYTANTAYRAIGSYDISAPAIARQTSMVGVSVYAAGTVELITWANNHNQSTAYDGITIYPASSTITGTVRIYGYRNS
jgi:hypothetical protein